MIVPIRNPVPRLSTGQIALKMFMRAYSMAILQAGGVTLIALGSYLAGITGFMISWTWIGATRDGNDHRHGFARFFYGLGGGLGTLSVVICRGTIKRLLAHF